MTIIRSRALFGILAVTAIACSASALRADTVAFWKFDGDTNAFIVDSSENRHTLTQTGGVSQVNGAASFSGGVLSADIDLTRYRQVTISWDQYGTKTGDQIVYEHSENYNNYAGALLGLFGSASLQCGNYTYNVDTFPASINAWQHVSVTYNLDAPTVGDVVNVYDASNEIIGTNSAGNQQQCTAPQSFIHNTFYIGNRTDRSVSFAGSIDNFKIEGTSVPEPGTLMLFGSGLMGLLCYAWRKRR
jgi:hypothetical protein